MSFEHTKSITLDASAAIVQYTFVTITTAGRAVTVGTLGADAVGVAAEAVSAADITAGRRALNVFQLTGKVEVVVGTGGVTAGDAIASDATGQAVTAATGNKQLGYALETAAAGARATILLTKLADGAA